MSSGTRSVLGSAVPARPRRRAAVGLLTATGVSVTANAMVAVLVPWLVLTRTGSAAQAGLVGAVSLATAVPALLLGGPLIDRWGKRRVSAGADVLSALAVASLPLLDVVVGLTLVSILALVAVGALFDGPGAAAREASRPAVAMASGTPIATLNARGEAVDGSGAVVGPALAGAGIGALGAMGSLWVATAMFAVAAVTTWWALPREPTVSVVHESHLRAAVTGVRHLWRDPSLRAIAVLGMVAMASVAPLSLILTAHLAPDGRAGTLGLVLSALAVGAVIGALVHGRIASRLPRRAVLIGALAGASGGFAAMAALPGTGALVALGGLTGLAIGPIGPLLAGLTQERTPPQLLGRIVSTTWSLSLLASPLALLLAGAVTEAAGPGLGLLVVAGGCAVTTLYAACARGLRHLDRPTTDGATP